jgi:hypothetical protein
MGNWTAAVANSWLDAFARNVSYANAAVWVKLHIGDPGAAGTANPAVEATRKQATFGVAASGGAISNSAVIEWLSVSTTETVSWVSFWTASTAGTFLGNDQLATAAALTAGDTFRIPTNDLDLTITTVL